MLAAGIWSSWRKVSNWCPGYGSFFLLLYKWKSDHLWKKAHESFSTGRYVEDGSSAFVWSQACGEIIWASVKRVHILVHWGCTCLLEMKMGSRKKKGRSEETDHRTSVNFHEANITVATAEKYVETFSDKTPCFAQKFTGSQIIRVSFHLNLIEHMRLKR